MAKKQYGPKYEKERRKQWELQRRVLAHLKEHGPSNYDGLYVLFDLDRSANIELALQGLREWESIEVGKDKMVTITASGLKRLAANDC